MLSGGRFRSDGGVTASRGCGLHDRGRTLHFDRKLFARARLLLQLWLPKLSLRRKNEMKIVSMVPSWTETLLACGIEVVGRTRFCVHPETARAVPVVGGTKDIDWKKIAELGPELLLLDREENPKSMAEEARARGLAYLATHVTNVDSVARELNRIAAFLEASLETRAGASAVEAATDESAARCLRALANRWQAVTELPKIPLAEWGSLPGVLEWLKKPTGSPGAYAYFIWRRPWMTVGRDTFIASMLEQLGLSPSLLMPDRGSKYPEISLEEIAPDTVLLFSSEPYPFGKSRDWLREISQPAALVDGESMSWFGSRSLEFLERNAAARAAQ
jgi:ABC-type Fe3+-hydroxamate transport system substrate-binding protein